MDFRFLCGLLVGFLISVPVSIASFIYVWHYFTRKVQNISDEKDTPRRL
ncbi:putative P3a protein [peach-associated luteovirus 2]|nr:putative P3a protein [peach-associated luteovirus 2]